MIVRPMPTVRPQVFVYIANPTRTTMTVHVGSKDPSPFRPGPWCGVKVNSQAQRSETYPVLSSSIAHDCQRCADMLKAHRDNVARSERIERERIETGRVHRFRVTGGGPGAYVMARDINDAADITSRILQAQKRTKPTDVVEIVDQPTPRGTDRRIVQVVNIKGRVYRSVSVTAWSR